MADSDTIPVWKKLYPIISGQNSNVTSDIVHDILSLSKEKLVNGLLEFKSYSRESYKSWKSLSGLKEIVADDEMSNFIHFLSKELDLEVTITWTMICNFLIFEYYGKVDELKLIIKYDTNVQNFTENMWYFYSADRMFLLKILRHLFEKLYEKDYVYYEEFKKFIESIDVKALYKNLLRTFDNLINEIDKDKSCIVSPETLVRWIHRNNREQLEVLMLLMFTTEHFELDGNELKDLLALFIRHGFTKQPLYYGSTGISRKNDLMLVKYAEIGCALIIMEKYWKVPEKCQMLPESTEKNLQLLHSQGVDSIVLFAWTLLSTSINGTDKSMQSCNLICFDVVERKVFKSLHEVFTSTIFLKSRTGTLMDQAVFTTMVEFIKICADFPYLHQQEGVCNITAELLKRKGLSVLNYLGPIFQLSIDAFPFIFEPFLEICKSLFMVPGKYESTMRLLNNIPGFLTEIPWSDHRQKFNLTSAKKIFAYSDVFVVPEGTLVERFNYHGIQYARYKHPFSFFTLLEEFTKSLSLLTFEGGTGWSCYQNLMELVLIGFRFIKHILQNYQGDFRSDRVLKTLIHRLQIVINQFPEGPKKNFDFIQLYFDISCTLVTHNLLDFTEAFPVNVRRIYLPQVWNYEKIDRQILFDQLHNGSLLFRSLREEESMSDHSLLIQYLKLIQHMVEKMIYQREVQLAGMWYILNVVFPLYQQWPYKDSHQQTTICKICCSICVQLFKDHSSNKSEESYEVYKMCLDSFMYQEVIMSSYLALFLKDKFYLHTLMEQESNWISGPTLDNIECLRLQLVLLLLLFKHRASLPEKTCTIDKRIGIISKAVSAYMITPYSVAVRILSCKFLEVVARDQNIPLLALLGLDYDQVHRLFLDKLRDPTEDDQLKLRILDLISTCIIYQHGMTAAFFNVTRPRKWYSDNREKIIECDTVNDFMIDYLQNVKKSHEYLRNPLQVGVLQVMATLWICGKHHLTNDIVSLKAFWPLLAEPLYREFNLSPTVYAHILKIFSIQLASTESSDKFIMAVEKFTGDLKQVESWKKYVLNIFKTVSREEKHMEERKNLLDAWMEFIIILEKKTGIKKFDDQSKFILIEMCLDGFHLKLVNSYCIEKWIDLCLIQISTWGIPHKPRNEIVARKGADIFKIVIKYYKDMTYYYRSAVLTITQIMFDDLHDHFKANPDDLTEFFLQFGPLLDHEYSTFEDEEWKKAGKLNDKKPLLILPWIMCTNIVDSLLKHKTDSIIEVWLSYHNYLQKLLNSICELINYPQTFCLAKVVINSLTVYAESPLYLDFLNMNMKKFYAGVEGPITAMLTLKKNKVNPMEMEDGWETCSQLMRFQNIYLRKFQYAALSNCYNFLIINDEIIEHIFNIPESTVALKGLDLLTHTLMLFDNMLVNWQLEWYRKSNKTYNIILSSVKKVINACLYTILRPRTILMFMPDSSNRLNQMEKVPIALMVGIMNKLIAATSLCFSIIQRVNPSLTNLLDVYVPDSACILIENDFSVPKFKLPIPEQLTYGMLLCLVHFLCKTLDAVTTREPQRDDVIPKQYWKCFGLIEHQEYSANLTTQKLSAFLRYAMYEYSGLADPWIKDLDYRHVKTALEHLMTFLAQQVYLGVTAADSDNLPYLKRNLGSELQFFYEYVKKHTLQFSQQLITTSYKMDVDILRRYLLYCQEKKCTDEIVEKNFCLVILYWFTNICNLR